MIYTEDKPFIISGGDFEAQKQIEQYVKMSIAAMENLFSIPFQSHEITFIDMVTDFETQAESVVMHNSQLHLEFKQVSDAHENFLNLARTVVYMYLFQICEGEKIKVMDEMFLYIPDWIIEGAIYRIAVSQKQRMRQAHPWLYTPHWLDVSQLWNYQKKDNNGYFQCEAALFLDFIHDTAQSDILFQHLNYWCGLEPQKPEASIELNLDFKKYIDQPDRFSAKDRAWNQEDFCIYFLSALSLDPYAIKKQVKDPSKLRMELCDLALISDDVYRLKKIREKKAMLLRLRIRSPQESLVFFEMYIKYLDLLMNRQWQEAKFYYKKADQKLQTYLERIAI